MTFYYEIYHNLVKSGMFVWEIKRLHEVYGPIVRINPREVHISDFNFLDQIYSFSRPRNKAEYVTSALDMRLSIGSKCGYETHKIRRTALTPFFSTPGVSKLESFVATKIEQLCKQLEESRDHARTSSNNMDSDTTKACSETRGELPLHFNVAQVVEALADPHSSSEKSNQGNRKTIFYELRDTPLLPLKEKSLDRLMHEGLLLVAAGASWIVRTTTVQLTVPTGSEATAKSLYVTHYHLLANPDILNKLRAELKTLPQTTSWAELEQLPYLTAVITEGNRLVFGLTMRNCRTFPTETLHYGSYVLPPG
ncbi:hypothetical protein MMC30_009382 [Trapelia coarctata]|nr:hypothetical protein [Trapelia coarctata]